MTATFVDVKLRIPNNQPLTYGQVDNNWTTLQHLMPIGAILDYPMNDQIPATWLECDGTALANATYAELYAVLGTTYGAGDGGQAATHFKLPDSRGYFMRHLGGIDTGRTIGDIQADANLWHRHLHRGVGGSEVAAPIARLGVDNGTYYHDEYNEYSGDVESRPKNMSTIRIIKALSVVVT